MRSIRTSALVVTISISLALAAAGCSGGDKPAGGGGGGFSMPPTPVEVAAIERGELVDRFDAVGTFEAVESIHVVSEVSGIVRELPFQEGHPVARGAMLARLEDSELSASLARAEATLEQARNSFERVKKVVEQKAGAPQDLDDSRATLKVAEAEAALARARLDKTRIRAPFAGYVGARLVDRGAYLQPGQTITTLTQLDELEVTFGAPERYVPRLNLGASVTVSTPAYPDFSVEGEITVVDPVVDPETRTVNVKARVPNPGLRFRPGMSADVAAILDRKSDALLVPSAAVFAQGGATQVYVVGPDSTVQAAPVKLGTRLADAVEVLDGIEPGAKVVRAGHQKLYPGAKVMPIPARTPGAPGMTGGQGGQGGAAGGAPGGGPGDASDGQGDASGTGDDHAEGGK